MASTDRARLRSPRQIGIAAVAAVAFIWLASLALASPDLPDFRAAGDPLPMPSAGSVQPIDLDAFGGLVAGQNGRVVVVNVWASWCAPCRAEMPLLQEAAAASGDSVVFLGVASNDQLGEAERFLVEVGVSYPNVFDIDGSIGRALEVSSYPTTYVFGVEGDIRARVNGGISEQRLAGLIGDALE